ncbi:MAG TPA: hypothetical protein VFS52_17645 [Steroidobacteraceae bacterium]|jgi:phage-related protein|nr:hypothetical protein [Steroidobacteraceae bacterium]
MRSKLTPGERPVIWVASAKKDLLAMPKPVVREIGVLHCFQKKSPTGIKTAKVDVNLVTQRLKAARIDYEARYGKTSS